MIRRIFIVIICLSSLFISLASSCSNITTASTPSPTPSAWLHIPLYSVTTKTIKVKVGDEFGVSCNMEQDMFPRFTTDYNSELFSIIDEQGISTSDSLIMISYWVLFKALKAGSGKITINYIAHLSTNLVPTTYDVMIIAGD